MQSPRDDDRAVLLMGKKVVAPDDRTGMTVFGEAVSKRSGEVRVEPHRDVYAPGPFWVDADEVNPMPDTDDISDEESVERKKWDIAMMVHAGALDRLDEGTLDLISSLMSEGHL